MERAYRLRIYPHSAQRELLAKSFGSARWVWNVALKWRSYSYKSLGEKVTGVDFSRELTFLKTIESYSWLKEVPATILNQTLRDQDTAFANFFAKRARYPKFKKKFSAQSIRFQLDQRIVTNYFRAGQLLKITDSWRIKSSLVTDSDGNSENGDN